MTGNELYKQYTDEYPVINGYREVPYESWLQAKVVNLLDAQKQINLSLGGVSNCTLPKTCLEKWMWKYAKEVEDTDNITGMHIDTNFRKWLADELMKEYYC